MKFSSLIRAHSKYQLKKSGPVSENKESIKKKVVWKYYTQKNEIVRALNSDHSFINKVSMSRLFSMKKEAYSIEPVKLPQVPVCSIAENFSQLTVSDIVVTIQ